MVAGLKQQTEIIMAQIGTFTRGEDGVFAGTIKTLSLNVKARLVPADASTNDKAPDLRVLVGNVEIGAAWHRTSKENTEVSLGQARRSVLLGADLRQPLQGRDRLHPRLVTLTDRCRDGSPA